jgi:site-specific DNA recombinase
MLEDAEHGKFDCILAKELSRIARNGELDYKVKRVLQTRNIQLITHDGAINTIEDNTDKFGLMLGCMKRRANDNELLVEYKLYSNS